MTRAELLTIITTIVNLCDTDLDHAIDAVCDMDVECADWIHNKPYKESLRRWQRRKAQLEAIGAAT